MVSVQTLPRRILVVPALLALAACGSGELQSPTSLPESPPAITELTLTPAAVTLSYVGATSQLTASLLNAKGNTVPAPHIYWVSLDSQVATVDTTGFVTGIAVGTARIRAQFLELADTAVITVARIPVAMELSVDSLLFTELGHSAVVQAKVWDGASTQLPSPDVAWSSSESGVASVDGVGTVKALADGNAVITATADTVVRSFKVRVASRPASMTVTPASVSLDGIGDTARVVTVVKDALGLSRYPTLLPSYTSSDTAVASVNFTGFINAHGAGTATITVTADTLVATVPVTVIQTVHSVRIVPDTATVAVGATQSYVVVVKDRFAQQIPGATVTWASSDTGVATVDASGTVTGVAPGTAVLTATSGSVSDTATVTVVVP